MANLAAIRLKYCRIACNWHKKAVKLLNFVEGVYLGAKKAW